MCCEVSTLKDAHLLDGNPGLKLQHTLAEQVTSESFTQLYNSLAQPNKRIVDSSMEKHAGTWLKAIPTEQKLSISSDKMIIALRLFLGIPLQKDVKECPICRKRIDDFNVHMLICSTKKSLKQRHDAIKHCVKELFAMQLSFMWMLKPLLLGREITMARRTRDTQTTSSIT